MRRTLAFAELPTGSALLLGALAVSNVSGYVFYVALSRLLSPDRYGAVGALVSAMTIIAVPAGAIQTVVARRASAAATSDDVAVLLRAALRGTAAFAAAAGALLLAAAPLVERFLHLGSLAPAVLLALFVLVALVAPVFRGTVHGRLHYAALAAALVTITVLRVALGIPLVAAGWDVTGAALAFLVAEVCGVGPAVRPLLPELRRRVRGVAPGLLRELARASVAVACYSAATNLDVVQVRHYFPHRASGLYAAASLVGRAVLLGSLSLTMLVFPLLARPSERARASLRWAVVGTAAIASAAVLVVGVAGAPLMRVVFGGLYAQAARVAVVSAASSACYALCGLLMYFHLAATSASAFAVVPAGAAQTAGIVLFHSSILGVAFVTLFAAAGLLALNGALLVAR
jgi:O-antigen/teichoic acid export membrane protein